MRLFRLLGLAILAGCIAFFFRLLMANLSKLPTLQYDAPLVAAAGVTVALVLVVYGLQILVVHLLLRGLGEAPRLREVAPIILLSQFAKYLPGNVGHYVGRIALGKKYGYGAQHLMFTLGYEIGWVILVAIAIGIATILHAGPTLVSDKLPLLPSHWLIAAALVAVVTLPPLSTLVLRRWRPKFLVGWLTGDAVQLPPLSVATVCMLLLFLTFVTNGLGLALLGQGLIGQGMDQIVLLIGIFAIAWLAGFVVPGAPGGLGVREAILAAGLNPLFGEPAALALTLGSRICFIAGDGLAFLAGLAAYRLWPPDRAQETPR